MAPILDIVLFGQLDISVGGSSLTSQLPKKAAALVAYLALSGRAHTRQALSDLLWGESSEVNARLSLRAALCALRKWLAPYLVITRQTIAFNTDCDHQVDVLTFIRATASDMPLGVVREPTGSAQMAELRAAVELYQGELMANWPVNGAPAYEEWLMMERQRLQELALRALYSLSSQYARLGAYDEAIAMVHRLLTLEPWQEEAHRQMMELLVLRGRRTEALMQYKACRRTLMLELGVEPTVETQRLYQDLVSAQRRGDGRSVHRGGGALGPRHNLPAQPMPIYGRQAEMAQLKRRLLSTDCRLLSVVGPGGVGKTRLAQAVAEDVREHFADGVWYVPLADVWQERQPPLGWGAGGPAKSVAGGPHAATRPSRITAGDLLMDGIGRALGLGTSSRRLPAAQVLAYLKQKRLLLVLDGLEPLVDDPGVLSDLLAAAAQTRLLVTCRRRLDLRGEQAVRIGRLPVPDPEADDLDVLAGLASVQVFGEWARRAWPEFALDSGNARDVAEICRTMTGVPLCIALAASMADHLTPEQIVQTIHSDPGQVTARWPDAPARHRGLRALCQYSHLLLSTEERAALRSLARLDAPFTVEEATQAARVPLVHLRALVEWNVVERAGPDRFFMAPMDRHFASARGE
jgi:DNA-binding SARP family transcriptional activator/predicted ATPase